MTRTENNMLKQKKKHNRDKWQNRQEPSELINCTLGPKANNKL